MTQIMVWCGHLKQHSIDFFSDGPYTLFAPSDSAFNQLGSDKVNALLGEPELLSCKFSLPKKFDSHVKMLLNAYFNVHTAVNHKHGLETKDTLIKMAVVGKRETCCSFIVLVVSLIHGICFLSMKFSRFVF